MSREIKFRAWSKNSKVMSKVFTIMEAFDYTAGKPENNIMQYTGLKDKNKKEIYEGDICEVRYLTKLPTVTGVVEWFNLHSHFSIRAKKDGPYSLSFGGSVVDGVYIINATKTTSDDLSGGGGIDPVGP